jgi:hypothetical protein
MLVGHFAAALTAKSIEPRVSLGTLVLAAMAADLLWSIFMIAGVEHVEFRSGKGAANYLVASDISKSHSLLMGVVLAGLLGAIFLMKRRDARVAWVVCAMVLSHWILDWISHRPDMPLAPGVERYFGLGLWTSIPATLVVEGGFWLLALILYASRNRAATRLGSLAFWSVVVLLTLAWYNNIAGPPPPDPRAAPIISLLFFSLVVAWAYWMNRTRHSPTD